MPMPSNTVMQITDQETQTEVKAGCFARWKDNILVQYISLAVALFVIILDWIFDWLLFYSVYNIQTGLIYGHVDDGIWLSLIFFCCTGTVIVAVEILNLVREHFWDAPLVSGDVINVISLWCEDLPQIILSTMIAACHEVPISFAQTGKLTMAVIGTLIRLLITIVRYIVYKHRVKKGLKSKKTKKERHNTVVLGGFMIAGMIATVLCASLIFFFNHLGYSGEGAGLTFQIPTGIFEGKLNTAKYFDNVSIFLEHPNFYRSCRLAKNGSLHIQLATIKDPMSMNAYGSYDVVQVQYGFAKINDSEHFYVKKSSLSPDVNNAFKCYLENTTNCAISVRNCNNFNNITFDKIDYEFRFHPPNKFLIFGELVFNAQFINSTGYITSYHDAQQKGCESDVFGTLGYFKQTATLPLFPSTDQGPGNVTYFDSGDNLIAVDGFWKTGLMQCLGTGHMAPVFSNSFQL